MQKKQPGFILALLISLAVIILIGLYYVQAIPHGYLQQYDEFYTLNRTLSFEKNSDWLTIWFNGEPDFKKPPLQYWLGALAIKAGLEPLLALRLWPLLFGLCLMAATGLLAYACAPKRPYAIPTAIILLTSSQLLWNHAVMAMLETGTAFFLTLTVASMILALRNSRWWIITGITAGLGFLQKSPAPILLTMCFVGWLSVRPRLSQIDETAQFSSPLRLAHFQTGAAIATILALFWPIAQTVRHGSHYLHIAFVQQIFNRFSPSIASNSSTLPISFSWLEWLVMDTPWLWPTALTSMLFIPFLTELRRNSGVKILLTTIFFFFFLFTIAGGKIYSRYLIQVMPFMSVLLAIVIAYIIKPPSLLPLLACIVVLATKSAVHDTGFLLHDKRSVVKQEIVYFSRSLPNNEKAVFFLPGVPPGLIVYYANIDRPIELVRNIKSLQRKTEQRLFENPHRVLSPKSKIPTIKTTVGEIEVLRECGDYISWRTIKKKDSRD